MLIVRIQKLRIQLEDSTPTYAPFCVLQLEGADCHDSVVLEGANCEDAPFLCYAPLRYATVYGYSDFTIVLGAVGKAGRVEHCERVHVIAATKRIFIANCRECVLFLGVNERPLIVGDDHKLLAVIDEEYAEIQATCVLHLPFSPLFNAQSHGEALLSVQELFGKTNKVISKAQRLKFGKRFDCDTRNKDLIVNKIV